MKITALILIIFLASGCALTKEQRRLKRASKKLEKLTDKFPELITKDTVWADVTYLKPKTELEIIYVPSPVEADTIIWRNADATLIRIQTKDTTYYTVICDTVTIRDRVDVPVDRIQPVKYIPYPLKWWQKALMWTGGVFIVILVARAFLFPYLNKF